MAQNRLAKLREGLGWSREDLAVWLYEQGLTEHRSGQKKRRPVHWRTIYRWEKGETPVPQQVAAGLCDLFGVSLDHLMGRDDGNGANGNGEERAA